MLRALALWLVLAMAAQGQSGVNTGTVGTISNLLLRIPSANQTVNVLGYRSANDGGGGQWIWSQTNALSTNMVRVAISGSSTGRWVLMTRPVTLAHFGAIGDGTTDDYAAVQAAFDWSASEGEPVYIPVERAYRNGTSPWLMTSAAAIIGESRTTSVLLKDFDSDKPDALISTPGATFPSWTNTTITVLHTNLVLQNFTARQVGTNTGPLVYLDNFSQLDAVDLNLFGGTNAADWNFTVRGHNVRARGLYVYSKGAIFQDGFHILGGTNGTLTGSEVYSGDDAVVFGGRNQSSSDWTVTGNVLSSSHGHAVRFSIITNTVAWDGTEPTAIIQRITVGQNTLLGGLERNAVIYSQENWFGSSTNGPSRGGIRDISLGPFEGKHGDIATHDGVNAYGVWIIGGEGFRIRGTSVRSPIRGTFYLQRTRNLSLIDCYAGPSQNTSSAWRPVDIVDYGENIRIIGGRYEARTNQTAIAAENVIGLSIIGTEVSGYGANGIAVGGASTNIVIANSLFNSGLATANGIAIGATNDVVTTMGNTFGGAGHANEITGTANGLEYLHVNTDGGLIIKQPDLGDLITLRRGSAEARWRLSGTRLWNITDQGIYILTSNDTDDTQHSARYAGLAYDTSLSPIAVGGMRVIGDASENSIYYGGGDSTLRAVQGHHFFTDPSHTNHTGSRSLVLNNNGLVLAPNAATSSGVTTGMVFQVLSDLLAIPYPNTTDAKAATNAAASPAAGYYSSDRKRLMIHDGTAFRGAHPGGPARVAWSASTPLTSTVDDYALYLNAASDQAVTLLSAADNPGLEQFWWKVQNGGTATLTPPSGTVGGRPSWTLTSGGVGVRLYSDGTNWTAQRILPANRRKFVWQSESLSLRGGSASVAVASSRQTGVALDEAATEFVSAITSIPQDFQFPATLTAYFVQLTTNTGNAAIQFGYMPYAVGDSIDTTTLLAMQYVAAPGVANQLFKVTQQVSLPSSILEYLRLSCYRIGGDGGDTLAGDVLLVLLTIEEN